MRPKSETLKVTRELINGAYHSVHVDKTGMFRVDTGLDDQRPDHDGKMWFRPIYVEQYMVGGSLYNYLVYCGKCRKKIGGMGDVKQYCSRCGAGVGHYIFAMGTRKWKPKSWKVHPPDQWPTRKRIDVVR